ncbi:MAG TPA: 1-deoxy-D-xylulose-5-phosphate reductoisomerase, partial [Sphaerochaeta sp.]|nr:1-deoxy-D-xylulose-5-phosphate reductoisomerase [Sphaerochaeta sp.]
SYLFGFKGEAIKVLIHPQSVVHSLIGTVDGAYYGQLSVPDMRLAITAALLDEPLHRIEPLDFSALTLEFFTPRWDVFPLLGLAYEILERSDSSAIAFNAADEVAVAAFLDTQISYLKMVEVVQRTVDRPWDGVPSTYEEILAVDQAARKRAEELI